MRRTWNRAKHAATHLWRGLREWCGDSAYERYLTGRLEDYEYPTEKVAAALAGLPKV